MFGGIMQGMGQNDKTQTDSLRTLKLLKETLQEVLETHKDNQNDLLDLEIDGLIVDQTITKMGKDFYDIFYSKWEAPRGVRNFIIVIREMILPGMGTQINIQINDLEVFKNRIQPRYDFVEELAQYACSVVGQYLVNYENMRNQLEGEDLQGSGIF